MALLPEKLLTPEEEELARKKAILSDLEAQLANRELELASFRADLLHFEKRYLQTVGWRYARVRRPRRSHSLATLPGVHRIHIDPTTESLVVDYDPQGTPLETFEDLIGQVGEPKPWTRKLPKSLNPPTLKWACRLRLRKF